MTSKMSITTMMRPTSVCFWRNMTLCRIAASPWLAATVWGLILTASHKEQIGELYPQVLETLVYGACRELFQ